MNCMGLRNSRTIYNKVLIELSNKECSLSQKQTIKEIETKLSSPGLPMYASVISNFRLYMNYSLSFWQTDFLLVHWLIASSISLIHISVFSYWMRWINWIVGIKKCCTPCLNGPH